MERVKNFENLERGMSYGCCEICGSWEAVETHHIFPGRALRPLSERFGAKIRLCHACHQTDADSVHKNRETALAVKKCGQRKVMLAQGWGVEEFRTVFGKNYLDGDELPTMRDALPGRAGEPLREVRGAGEEAPTPKGMPLFAEMPVVPQGIRHDGYQNDI